MNKKVIIIFCVLMCLSLIGCKKVDKSKEESSKTQNSQTSTQSDDTDNNLEKNIKEISDSLKGVEITQDDLNKIDENQINKVVSEQYQGEVAKDTENTNRIEIGIVSNVDTKEQYSLSDLFNINDDFVNLIITTSQTQLDDMQKMYTNNFDNNEWKTRLNNVSQDGQISYFVLSSADTLDIYFDVPNAYGSYMKVASIEKSHWINYVKDSSLF